MTTKTAPETTTRTIERCMEIQAPVEHVWKALTEAEELMRWFPLQAEVEPGDGGTMRMSWDDWFKGVSEIEIWEPNKHLRTTFFESPDSVAPPVRTHVDYHLEARGGSTILRLVHSGIGSGADWDNLYDGVKRGWRGELCSLRHYLERHHGAARRVAWCIIPSTLPRTEIWERLFGTKGLRVRNDLVPGDRFSAVSPGGDEITGTIILADPEGTQFCATVESLGDAYLRVEYDQCSGNDPGVWLWIATYGLSEGFVSDLEERWSEWLRGLLAA